MNPNTVIIVLGSIAVLQGLAVFIGAEAITMQAFGSDISSESVNIGIVLHEIMGALSVAIGIILLVCRELETDTLKTILLGTGCGLSVTFAVMLKHIIVDHANPPLPVIIIQAAVILTALYTSRK